MNGLWHFLYVDQNGCVQSMRKKKNETNKLHLTLNYDTDQRVGRKRPLDIYLFYVNNKCPSSHLRVFLR